jgi:signal transduction histidine kinase
VTWARRSAWWWFVATALLLAGVVLWLTQSMLSLEREEVGSRALAESQQRLRLALWRMDSWLSPQLAGEAQRAVDEFARLVAPTETLVALRCELNCEDHLQVPSRGTDAGGTDAVAHPLLAGLRPQITYAELERRLAAAEAQLQAIGGFAATAAPPEIQRSVAEYTNRAQANAQSQMRGSPSPLPTKGAQAVGPLVPMWSAGELPMLLCVRRAPDAQKHKLQILVVDWTRLQRELLALVQDLFPEGVASLAQSDAMTPEEQGRMLASVPARLVTNWSPPMASALPVATILWITWGMTAVALLALGFMLRAAIGYGDRRARFASAVTHELRTPLTTFRMYSEMLADGMVTDPAAQHEYLETLRTESDRLSRVVENVLAWSRLEQGRFASRRERHVLAALLHKQAPTLQQRLAQSGLVLDLDIESGAESLALSTDDEAIGQILFNLIDNAAKYARGARDPHVHVVVRRTANRAQIDVRDHGEGVPAAFAARIFAPFDRGARQAASNDAPGVGLGLPLARALARDLGGELELVPGGDGACFRLTLPCL